MRRGGKDEKVCQKEQWKEACSNAVSDSIVLTQVVMVLFVFPLDSLWLYADFLCWLLTTQPMLIYLEEKGRERKRRKNNAWYNSGVKSLNTM